MKSITTGGQSTPDVGLRPLSKPQRTDQPSSTRDTGCRCFDIAEVADALELPSGALHGFIQAGLLVAAIDIGCRRLVTADAVLALVPEPTRQEVRSRLDAIESRRGSHGES